MKLKEVSIAVSVLLLAACGGSGNSDSVDTGKVVTVPDTGTVTPPPTPAPQKFEVKPLVNLTTKEDMLLNIDITADKVPDGTEAVAVEIIENVQLGTLSGQYPALTYTPHENEFGVDSFSFKLKKADKTSEIVKVNLYVTAVNDAPTISGVAPTSLKLGDEYVFQPNFDDIDSTSLQFTVENKPAWLSFDERSGRLTGKPTTESDIGTTQAITISVSDGEFTATLPAFNITVASQPWTEAALLPGFEGSHLNANAHAESLYTLTHNYAYSSAMICMNAPASAPKLSRMTLSDGSWLQLASPQQPRFHYQSQWVGDKLYLFGGTEACSIGTKATANMEIYDSAANTWQLVDAPILNEKEFGITTSCTVDDQVLVFTNLDNKQQLHVLNTADNSWQSEVLADSTAKVKKCFTQGNALWVVTANDTTLSLGQFDLATKTVINAETIPNVDAKRYFDTTLIGNKLYLASATSLQSYDFTAPQWQTGSANPFATEDRDGTMYYLSYFKLVGYSDRLLSVGGAFTSQAGRQIYQYKPDADK